MSDAICPMCGTPCRIVGSDEGTHHYEPLGDAALRAQLGEQEQHLATQILECRTRLNAIIAPNEPRSSRVLTPEQFGALPMIEAANTVTLTYETFGVLLDHIDTLGEQHQAELARYAMALADAELAHESDLAEAADLRGRLERAEAALRKMANPIRWFQEEAKRTGGKINGVMAIRLEDNAGWYRVSAQAALADIHAKMAGVSEEEVFATLADHATTGQTNP